MLSYTRLGHMSITTDNFFRGNPTLCPEAKTTALEARMATNSSQA